VILLYSHKATHQLCNVLSCSFHSHTFGINLASSLDGRETQQWSPIGFLHKNQGYYLLCGMRHQVSTKNMFFHEQLSSIIDIRSLLYYMIIYIKVYCVSISYPQGVDVCRFINHKKKHLVAGRVGFLNPAISTDKTQ
jgi:hypothetical protein